MADFYIKQNDTKPILQAQLQDEDENPIDITDSDVRFHMRNAKSDDLIVDKEATIDDADNGEVSYTWREGDTQNPGRYNGEFEVEYNDGSFETFPNDSYIEIMIQKELS